MRYELTPQQRKRVKAKMAEVFKGNLAGLSTEFQKILLDDLVTAFQNRMNVLKRVQAKKGLLMETKEEKEIVSIHKSFI